MPRNKSDTLQSPKSTKTRVGNKTASTPNTPRRLSKEIKTPDMKSQDVKNQDVKSQLQKEVVSQNKNLGKRHATPQPSKITPTLMADPFSLVDFSVFSDSKHLRLRKQLSELVKVCNREHAKLDADDDVPPSLHSAEKMLQEFVLSLSETVENFDGFIQLMYHDNMLNIEQKARLRETVVKLFSCVYFGNADNPSSDLEKDGCIVDVYALPVYGSATNMVKASEHPYFSENLSISAKNSGYFGEGSDVHVLSQYPLDWRALSVPSVLTALATMYGELILRPEMPKNIRDEIFRAFESAISPYVLTNATCGFVVPCIRVWRGTYSTYRANEEIGNKWNNTQMPSRVASQSIWQTLSSHALGLAAPAISRASVLLRPPSPPLVAQSHALAWQLTQQVYERLGTAAFSEINFVTVSDNTLALRAYDHRQRILAQSDVVGLFDVITAPDDFSILLREECDAAGPRSQLRETARSN